MRRIAIATIGALLAATTLAGTVSAAKPARDGGRFTETFFDDVIWDMCGIATMTTLTQSWSVKDFADGSTIVHVTRTYVPDDQRIPIEKGAASSLISPDGTRRVVGTPIHLISQQGGGTTLLDAGWIRLDDADNILDVRGPHPGFTADLAQYYCPA